MHNNVKFFAKVAILLIFAFKVHFKAIAKVNYYSNYYK